MPLERPLVGVIFVRVNQVLVRLWARCGRMSDRMWLVLRDGSSRGRGSVFRDVCCVLSEMILVRDRSWLQVAVRGPGCL